MQVQPIYPVIAEFRGTNRNFKNYLHLQKCKIKVEGFKELFAREIEKVRHG